MKQSDISSITGNPFSEKEKRAARRKANHAVATGLLTPQPCQICGAENAEKHHEDYSEPLKLAWLCHECHMTGHRIEKRSKRTLDPVRVCQCGERARLNQWNCHDCNNRAQWIFKARIKAEAERLEKEQIRNMRERFEATTSCVLHFTDS